HRRQGTHCEQVLRELSGIRFTKIPCLKRVSCPGAFACTLCAQALLSMSTVKTPVLSSWHPRRAARTIRTLTHVVVVDTENHGIDLAWAPGARHRSASGEGGAPRTPVQVTLTSGTVAQLELIADMIVMGVQRDEAA